MCGLVWFVQVAHYPLFLEIGQQDFVQYERKNTIATSFVTAPMMLIELLSGLALVYLSMGNTLYWLNLIGVALLWLSTFFIQVPLHNRLLNAYDPQAIRRLVRSNWIRTFLWTARAVILLGWGI